jgi:hypothetical protein
MATEKFKFVLVVRPRAREKIEGRVVEIREVPGEDLLRCIVESDAFVELFQDSEFVCDMISASRILAGETAAEALTARGRETAHLFRA